MSARSCQWVWSVALAACLCWPATGFAGEFGDGDATDNPALLYPPFSGRCAGADGELVACPEAVNCVPSAGQQCVGDDWALRGPAGEMSPPRSAPYDLTWSVTKSLSGEYEAGSEPRYLASLRPQLDFERDGNPGSLSGGVGADFRYLANDSAYFSSFGADLEGSFDLSSTSSLFASGDLGISVPDPDDTGQPANTAVFPITVEGEVAAGWRQRFGRISTELRAGAGRVVTSNTVLDDSTVIDNAELRRTGWGGGARIGVEVTPIWGVFVDAGARREVYDAPSTGLGVPFDNTTYRAEVGVAFERDETLSGEVSFGGLRRGFDDGTLTDVTTYVADAGLEWSPNRRTALSATLSTDVTPTTEPGATTEVSRSASIEASYDASDVMRLRGSVSAELDTFSGVPEQTSTTSVGLGVDYVVNRFTSLFATLTGTSVTDTTDGNSQSLGFEAGITVSN